MKVFSFDAVDQGVVGMMVVNSDGKYNSYFLIDYAIISVLCENMCFTGRLICIDKCSSISEPETMY